MIEVSELTKRYGDVLAVDRLSFAVRPGSVTGFLGPNGAGKTTTLRVLLGLAAPASGTTRVNGRRYDRIRYPMREVGALLDASAAYGGRTAYDHLRCLARANRIGAGRVAETLELVGLSGAARRRIAGFSLGMRQRLGIALALLGDPGVLVLDEPVNGLDADGVRWVRGLTRSLAAEGRTVLVSSHLMSEMELTADRLVIVGRGRLIADTSMRELAGRFDRGVFVRTARPQDLAGALRSVGAEVTAEGGGRLTVRGTETTTIGELAARHTIPVYEMTPRAVSLEEAYLELTAGADEDGVTS